eukprot:jgi/Pico_ML_1/52714/g3384.t1
MMGTQPLDPITAKVMSDFDRNLAALTFNSKPVITTLTMIAIEQRLAQIRYEESLRQGQAMMPTAMQPQYAGQTVSMQHQGAMGGYAGGGGGSARSQDKKTGGAAKAPGRAPIIGTEFKDLSGNQFKDVLIKSLYDSIPYQCKTTGCRFHSQEKYSKHLDALFLKNRRAASRGTNCRQWYPKESGWLMSAGSAVAEEEDAPPVVSAAPTAAEALRMIHSVPADDDQKHCAITGEPFETFWHPEEDEWHYRDAVNFAINSNEERSTSAARKMAWEQEGTHPVENVFTFDSVLGEYASQEDLYKQVEPTVDHVLEGHNGCIFTYGQTGAGKTHSLLGRGGDPKERGIVWRVLDKVWEEIDGNSSNRMTISVVEMYCEKLRDLVDPTRDNLPIKTTAETGAVIVGVSETSLTSKEKALEIINKANNNRAVSTTAMNQQSSRSHLILILKLQMHLQGKLRSCKLCLLDLAGSERQQKSGTEGQQLEEAIQINKSLSALGNTIYALTDGKTSHVRYRDSKLTRLLQDSLGGNSYTTLVLCCSPATFHASETLSTLRFGARAKLVENKILLDADVASPTRLPTQEVVVAALLDRVSRLEQCLQEREQTHATSDQRPPWTRFFVLAVVLELILACLSWSSWSWPPPRFY